MLNKGPRQMGGQAPGPTLYNSQVGWHLGTDLRQTRKPGMHSDIADAGFFCFSDTAWAFRQVGSLAEPQ